VRFDPEGRRVLLLGDSLSLDGGPIDVFRRTAEARGAEFRILARKGRTVVSAPRKLGWANHDVVVVALGTNDHGHSTGMVERSAEALLEAAGRVARERVIWVGPPAVLDGAMDYQLQRVDRALHRVVGDRDYFSLRVVTEGMSRDGRTRDGVHFTRDGSRWVADGISSVLLPPVGEDPAPRARVVLPPSAGAMFATGLLALVLNRRVRLEAERLAGKDV
jgi:hypothetical protein